MKKLLASLLVLAMCAPAMAVTFSTSAGPAGSGLLNINYTLAAGEGIRGLALTLDVTSGDGKVSGTVAGTHFIVAPFNTFVDFAFDATTYNVGDGHPFADKAAAGTATLPASNLSICLGYLDQAGAQAAVTTSGTITVKFNLTTDTTVAVALDTLRGGVVGDGLAATTGLPASQLLQANVVETITGTPVVTKTTAAPAIAARVNGGRVETFVASGVASSLGHALQYQFTWGDGTTSAWGPATQTKTYTYGGAGVVSTTGYTYNVTVQARCAADTAVVSAVSAPLALTSEAVKSTATFYAKWAEYSRKDCWAYPRNCNGDVDGLKQGSVVLGYTWVSTNDLTTFLGAYNIKEPTKGIGIMNIPGHPNAVCADFDHAQQGSVVLGYTRVSTNDLTIFLASYNDKEPTKGPGVPVCAQTNYHYWTKSPL